MVKIEKDSSALESEIRPLIDAANTKEWKAALNILFLNGSVLEFLRARALDIFLGIFL